jgi:tetratricopeptide (TPR) repeat protein
MIRRAIRTALVVALFASFELAAPPPSSASPSTSAAMLVQQGHEQEKAGNTLLAMKRYSDAIALDPTCEDAYLALGWLRVARYEDSEADQVFTTGITRIPASVALVLARGKERRMAQRFVDAADDLQHVLAATADASTQVSALVELVSVRRAQGEPAAELGAWRRLLALARATGDADLEKKASIQTRALGLYLGEVDPALAGRADVDDVRRALAAIARRQ